MIRNIPSEWQWQGRGLALQPPYWVTYYGDIYSGRYYECHSVDDRFFIISNNELQEFNRLQDHSLENYQRLGWEIKDPDIILQYIKNVERLGEAQTPAFMKSIPQECKRIFIFGAGASSNCITKDYQAEFKKSELNPPDSFRVFDKRFNSIISKYNGVLAAIPSVNLKKNDIESCFEEDWEEIRDKFSPHLTARHINAQFYLQELFTEISNDIAKNHFRGNLYQTVVDKVLASLKGKDERAVFISFNYDTILDTSVERTLGKYNDISDYVDHAKRKIILLKPHGSVNWGWPFRMDRMVGLNGQSIPEYLYEKQWTPSQIYYNLLGDYNTMVWEGSWGIEKSWSKNYLGRFTINKNKIEVINNTSGKKYFPALQLPYRDKDELVMPYDHYDGLISVLRKTEEIFLIGWKGNEELFNRILKIHLHNLKKVVIVNPDPETVRSYLKPYIDISEGTTRYDVQVVEDFEDFVVNKMDFYLKNPS